MSAVINSVINVGPGAWTFNFSGTAPYTALHQGEVLANNILEDYYTVSMMVGYLIEPPALEILDATESLPSPVQQFPGIMQLQWRGRVEAQYYIPQYFVSPSWVDLPPVFESGRGYYTAPTPWLDDAGNVSGGIELFRVKVIDDLGNESGTVPFDFLVIRHPDPPEVVVTWNDTLNQIEVNLA